MQKLIIRSLIFAAVLALAGAPLSASAQILEITGGMGGVGGQADPDNLASGTDGSAGVNIPTGTSIAAQTGGTGQGQNGGAGGQGEGMSWTITSQAELGGYTGLTLTGGQGNEGAWGLGTGQTGGVGGNGGDLELIFDAEVTLAGNTSFIGGASAIAKNSRYQQPGHTGANGRGGNVQVVLNQEVSFLGGLTLVGGTGSAGGVSNDQAEGNAGDGGAGGTVTLEINSAFSVEGVFRATGGNGGSKGFSAGGALGSAGNGGAGGSVIINVNQEVSFDSDVEFVGGEGFAGNSGANSSEASSGVGGDVIVNTNYDLHFAKNLTLTSGKSGYNSGSTAAQATGETRGGNVEIRAAGFTVTVDGLLQVVATNPGPLASTYPVASVIIEADKLVASGGLDLVGNRALEGEIVIKVNELHFDQSADFSAVNTVGVSADGKGGVYFDTIVIGGVDDQGNLLTGIRVNNTAVSGLGQGHFGFGGKLKILGDGQILAQGQNMQGVTNLIFELGADSPTGKTLLKIETGALNISQARISINPVTDLAEQMEIGDSLVLVDHVDNNGVAVNTAVYTPGGLITSYTFAVTHSGTVGDSLDAVFLGETLSAGAAHSLGMAAGAGGLLRSGAQDLASSLIQTSLEMGSTNNGNRIRIMAGLAAGQDQYQLNSEIKLNRFHLAIGPALDMDLTWGEAVLGVFLEAGWASWDIINDNPVNPIAYNGSGHSRYLGGGLAAGLTLDGGFHTDASISLGKSYNEFEPDWLDVDGFELNSSYLSLHLTAGWLVQFTEKHGLDLYGKLFWTRQAGGETYTSNNQRVFFEDFSSLRSVLGANYQLQLNQQIGLYAGLAWEYQFRAEQELLVDYIEVEPARFEGHSALLNLGLDLKAGDNIAVGLNLQGALGKRAGYGGNLAVSFRF